MGVRPYVGVPTLGRLVRHGRSIPKADDAVKPWSTSLGAYPSVQRVLEEHARVLA